MGVSMIVFNPNQEAHEFDLMRMILHLCTAHLTPYPLPMTMFYSTIDNNILTMFMPRFPIGAAAAVGTAKNAIMIRPEPPPIPKQSR